MRIPFTKFLIQIKCNLNYRKASEILKKGNPTKQDLDLLVEIAQYCFNNDFSDPERLTRLYEEILTISGYREDIARQYSVVTKKYGNIGRNYALALSRGIHVGGIWRA